MISREQKVTQSVQDYVVAGLAAAGYVQGEHYDFVDSYEGLAREGLARTTMASGFDFDDEGRQAEMGSDLKQRLYTVQFVVFGTTEVFAKNIASQAKFVIDADGVIPLKDLDDPDDAVIGYLDVVGVSAERQNVVNPEPWQEHIWSCTARVQDEYHARLVA